MLEFIDMLFGSLFALGIAAWTMLMGSRKIVGLDRARIAFSLAMLCLYVVAGAHIATMGLYIISETILGGVTGALLGIISYLVWIGIDGEIAALERKERAKPICKAGKGNSVEGPRQ